MVHIKYNKIHRLGKEEVEGILEGEVTVQEKIDGANVSIWVENGLYKFGNSPRYAKIVTNKFQEDNKIQFGGNDKYSQFYHEQYVCNKYMTDARIEKIVMKIESSTGKAIDLSDTPRVAQTAYHDLLEEEIWEIQKDVEKLNLRNLKRICQKKAALIFKARFEHV